MNIKVNNIDLSIISSKLNMPPPDGHGWTTKQVKEAIEYYGYFLTLCAEYPNLPIVPCYQVDQVWHTHILFTEKYASDCEKHIGRFIHHLPFVEGFAHQKSEDLMSAYETTNILMKKHFGKSQDCMQFFR